MKRIALIASLVAVAVVPAVAQAKPIPSEVKITKAFADMGSLRFKGKVTSPAQRCAGPGRPVSLYRAGPGDDEFVEFTETNDRGKWSINAPLVAGKYYVLIEKLISLGDERSCAGDKSKQVEFN